MTLTPKFSYLSIIRGASTANEAIVQIFSKLKLTSPNLSLVSFGRKIGIKHQQDRKVSKIVNDVFKGRRKLSMEHAEKFCKAFKFHPNESICFKLLTQRDLARSSRIRNELSIAFDHLSKKLAVESAPAQTFNTPVKADQFGLKVLSAFGLANKAGEIKEGDLIKFFGKEEKGRIRETLRQLEKKAALVRNGSIYRLNKIPPLKSDIELNRLRLTELAQDIGLWFDQPDKAFFLTSTLSINVAEYPAFLESFRKVSFESLSKIDRANGADMLVDVNIAITPIFSCP